jgi:hypothetical protein
MNIIDSYFFKKTCKICGLILNNEKNQICTDCLNDTQISLLLFLFKENEIFNELKSLKKICYGCLNFNNDYLISKCESIDCEIFFDIKKIENNFEELNKN